MPLVASRGDDAPFAFSTPPSAVRPVVLCFHEAPLCDDIGHAEYCLLAMNNDNASVHAMW